MRGPSFTQIAADLGVSEDAARAAAHRLRRRYRVLLRAEVTGTLEESADISEEIAALFAALSP